MAKSKITQISETNVGVYVWKLPDGGYLMDGDLNVLSIGARRGDLRAMANISAAARSFGYEGYPEFVEGARKIDDDEFEEQEYRLANGLVPDKYDIGSFRDDVRRTGK